MQEEKKNRDSFVIFKNWTDAINALPEEYQLEAYKALIEYAITGEIPSQTTAVTKAILISFSVSIQNSICRHKASIENGKKGGRPKKASKENEGESKSKNNPEKPTQNLNRKRKEKEYSINPPTPNGVSPLNTKNDIKAPYCVLVNDSGLPTKVQEQVMEWLEYKKWKYTEVGIKSLLTTVAKNVDSYGESAVCAVMVESMGNMWQGICWDKLGRKESRQEEKDEPEYTVDGDYYIFKNGQRVHKGTYEGWVRASKGS